jgi:hypothetical protein
MEAEIAMTMGLPDKALEAYDRVLALDPANRQAQEGRRDALLRMAAENLSRQSLPGCETAMDVNRTISASIVQPEDLLSLLKSLGIAALIDSIVRYVFLSLEDNVFFYLEGI